MMKIALLLVAMGASSVTAPTVSDAVVSEDARCETARTPADGKVVKLLEKWLKAYRSGKIAVGGGRDTQHQRRLKKGSIGVKGGVIEPMERLSEVPKEQIDHEDELRAICEKVAELNDIKAVQALLLCASVGLDRKAKYSSEMVPALVRELGEANLDKISDREALDWIAKTALEPGKKPAGVARQVAAVRALGRAKDVRYVETIVSGLSSQEPLVRLHAADAIYVGQYKAAIPGLIERIAVEDDHVIKMRIVDAIHRVCLAHQDALDVAKFGEVAAAVGAQVGKAKWQYDLAAVGFLEFLRRKECVPPLIDILTRFAAADQTAPLDSSLSNIVRLRAYGVLREISGAEFAIEDTAGWNEWWTKVEPEFEPTEDTVSYDDTTLTVDFFGVPVEGSRVLFVVDTSGSMGFPKVGKNIGKSGVEVKMDVAKRELTATAKKLPAGSAFNLAHFGASAEVWQSKLVSADEGNIKKFSKFVKKLRPAGGTNLWDGLKVGLDAHSFVHGDRFGIDVDEVFILSDGLPSLGDITEPDDILSSIREANSFSKVRIHTIYIGGDPADEKKESDLIGMTGAELMRQIAEQNGGQHKEF